MTYFDDLKFEQFASDTDSYFQQPQKINFDIINHKCCGTPLQNSEQYYKTIQKKDFKDNENHVQTKVIASTIKSEHDDIYFEHDLLRQHFKEKTDIETYLVSNGFSKKIIILILLN